MIITFFYSKNTLPLLLLFLCFNLFAQTEVLEVADEMPYFTGCTDATDKRACSNQNLVRFISNQLVYPDLAKEQGVEGTVYVSFIVDENGKSTAPNIIRDIGGGCGKAAIELINAMPPWEAAIHNGKKVKVKLNLPIHFALKNNTTNQSAQNYEINWGNLASQKITKEELIAQLEKKLHVRDAFGNEKSLSELIFSFERKRTYLEESSTGKINANLKKLISKCKKGGIFTIIAVVQIKGEFVYVKRSFEVI